MENNLIIIGASGFGREVAWLVERINNIEKHWNLLGFLDDNDEIQGKVINGYPILGKTDEVILHNDCWFVCAIGSAKVRKQVISKIISICPDLKFATLIDPSVEKSNYVEIGEGTIICAHTILTVNIQIGKHVIINLDCTVGHDAILEDFVTLYPSVNISGMTHIGCYSELGTGVQIIQEKTVEDNVIVGAGAVIVKDILKPGTYVGCPAKSVKNNE